MHSDLRNPWYQQFYLELSCLGVGNVHCSGFWNLLPKLVCYIFLRTLKKKKYDASLWKFVGSRKQRLYLCVFMLTRAKLRASVNPAAARSCLSSSVSLLSGNCERVKQAHKKTQLIRWDKMSFGYLRIHKPHSDLVSYCIGARCGAGYVVETIGNGGVLHDITSVDDVWSCGWDLNLNLITNTRSLGAEAHPSEQLGNLLCWLAVRDKTITTHCRVPI